MLGSRGCARSCRTECCRLAPTQVLSQTRALTRRLVAAIDAAGERRRREQARCTRDVWVSPDEDGIATLVARLDALTAHAIRAAVDSAAQDPAVAGDCAATAGERRAEALAALVLGQVQVTAQVDVLVPLTSLLGDAGATAMAAARPLPTARLPARRHGDAARRHPRSGGSPRRR